MSILVERAPQLSNLLGRHVVHDSRSRAFAAALPIDRSSWRDKAIRIYDPTPNPEQAVGCCTGVAKCVQLNAAGNRRTGRVLKMEDALRIYSRNTEIDPWAGSWPPTDTGSSGLASAKTAQEFGLAGEYRWLFGGADEVVQAVMAGETVSVGTWWYWDMMQPDPSALVRPTGGRAGGHQYTVRGYDKSSDRVLARNWWGSFRDFWITRADLNDLLMDDGDAHFQRTT